MAFADAIRTRIDPEAVLDLVCRLLADEETPIAQRLSSALPFLHAGYLKPPTDANINVNSGAAHEEHAWLVNMSPEERHAEFTRRAAVRARYATAPGPDAIDDASAGDMPAHTDEESP